MNSDQKLKTPPQDFAGVPMPPPLTAEPYGREMAEEIFDELVNRYTLPSGTHRYAGMGLVAVKGEVQFGRFKNSHLEKVVARFSGKKAFVDWFSQQSEQSLLQTDGEGSPRLNTLTREFIQTFLNPPPAGR